MFVWGKLKSSVARSHIFARSKRSTTLIFFIITAANERPWQLNWNCKKSEREKFYIANIGTWVSNNISQSLGSCIFHFFFARTQSLLSSVRMRSGVTRILSLTPRTRRFDKFNDFSYFNGNEMRQSIELRLHSGRSYYRASGSRDDTRCRLSFLFAIGSEVSSDDIQRRFTWPSKLFIYRRANLWRELVSQISNKQSQKSHHQGKRP